ncbi:MAG: VOC family protein [Bacilli bacterium]
MNRLLRMDNISVIVRDLQTVCAFFVELGMEIEGSTTVEGDWVDRLLGLENVKSEIVMLRTADGQQRIELSTFIHPTADEMNENRPVNTLGVGRLMFAVTDIDEVIARLIARGGSLVGEVVNYETMYRLCYMRAPEGIMIALAEEL